MRLRRRRLSLAQEGRQNRGRLPAARPLRRRRKSQHVGVCASFTNAKRLELVKFLAPYRENALDGHPWREWAEGQPDADARAATPARRAESLERGEGLVVGAAAPGARRPGRVRPHAGRPLPPHRAVSPLAHRQAPAGLHLRSARGRAAAGARGDLRHRPLATDSQVAGRAACTPLNSSVFPRTRPWRPQRFDEEASTEGGDGTT